MLSNGYLHRSRSRPSWIAVGWAASTHPVAGYRRDRRVVDGDAVDEPNLVDWRHAASKRLRLMIDGDVFVARLNDVVGCGDDEILLLVKQEDGPDNR